MPLGELQFLKLLSMHTQNLQDIADEGHLVHPNELVHLTRQASHLEELFIQLRGVKIDGTA